MSETIWTTLRAQAALLRETEPALAVLSQTNILHEADFRGALCRILSAKLASIEVSSLLIYDIFKTA
ncbi:MAG: hypothetical protein HY052_08325, partial [Proteobacteria bacterium]|nr:hypothetical protein [Pseudomonadota bacterium]